MLPLVGRAAADSKRSWIGRSDRALPKDGSWTRAPEALTRGHPRSGVAHAGRVAEAGKNRAAEG